MNPVKRVQMGRYKPPPRKGKRGKQAMKNWYSVCKVVRDSEGRSKYQTEVLSQEEFAALVNENKTEWDFLVVDVSSFADGEMYFGVMMKRIGE